ncbi:MAG TPA: AraC family transcriptional regulator [Tepidisphaeraceae bacterium]
MDFLLKEWGSYRRCFPSTFPLSRIDFIGQKRQWIRHAFDTCNFSLILRGRGEYRRLGRTWIVEAPCVITQWPGEPVEYGPLAPDGSWDELYLMYDARLFPSFQSQHLAEPDRPVWPIRNLAAVEARISELRSIASSRSPSQIVDCLDRLCELLILETQLQPETRINESDESLAIWRIERELAGNLDQEVAMDELAKRNGMSPATFRRRWAALISVSPARYRLETRLREACQLLVQTDWPVFKIARTVGFSDELYFSRRFSQEFKVSPRTYRCLHHMQSVNGGSVASPDLTTAQI